MSSLVNGSLWWWLKSLPHQRLYACDFSHFHLSISLIATKTRQILIIGAQQKLVFILINLLIVVSLIYKCEVNIQTDLLKI